MYTSLPIDTTTLQATPVQTGFPSGTNLIVVTPAGAVAQTPASLLSASVFINAKAVGATGDGSTNDRVAIQSALTSASSAGGGTVYLPPGNYYVASALTVPANVILFGDGALIKSNTPTEGAKLTISSSNVTIRGITFDGAYTSSSGTIDQSFGLIDVIGSNDSVAVQNVIIENCTFRNGQALGVRLKGNLDGVRVRSSEFKSLFCSIFGNAYSTAVTLKNVFITSNQFRANWGSGNESGAVKIQGDDVHSLAPFNVVVDGNAVEASGQMGIELWNFCTRSAVRNNQISGVDFGISIDQGSYVTVADNVVSKCAYAGIELASICNHCHVSDNVVSCYSAGTTRGGQNGIVSSNVSCYLNNITGNSVTGCAGRAINVINVDRYTITDNTIADSATLFYSQDSSRVVFHGNHLWGNCGYHVFLDVSGANCTDIDIYGNHFYGVASNENIIVYDGGNNKTLTNLRISANNSIGATYAGYFPINRLPDVQLPNYQVYGNYYIDGTGNAAFIDYNTAAPAPFAPSIQKSGISVAARGIVTAAASGVARWVKVFTAGYGNVFYTQAHFFATNTSNGEGSAVNVIISAAPYGNGGTVTVLPNGDFSGLIDEVIYNQPGSSSTQEVWLKLRPSSYAYTVACYFSDVPAGVVASPTLTTTQPTWDAVSYRATTQPTGFGGQVLQPPAIHTQRYILAASRGALSDIKGRLYIKGVGNVGGSSGNRVATFEDDSGNECFGVEAGGRVLLPRTVKIGAVAADIKSICSNSGSLNFGTIGATSEVGVDLYVAGALTANCPSVDLGWTSALPVGVSVKTAFVNASDSVSIILQNNSTAGVVVGSVTVRATVHQY